ncbi:MAG: rhodanese-like domain-containing protein [Alphaproteobacteria bacterium]
MKLEKGHLRLLEEARAVIEVIDVNNAMTLLGSDDVAFIDLREIQELHREGMVPDAFHAPRGLLEFWADPESPYHKPVFASGKNLILYCSLGWRSALATRSLMEMGVPNIRHMEGGFTAWKEADGEIQEKTKKQ